MTVTNPQVSPSAPAAGVNSPANGSDAGCDVPVRTEDAIRTEIAEVQHSIDALERRETALLVEVYEAKPAEADRLYLACLRAQLAGDSDEMHRTHVAFMAHTYAERGYHLDRDDKHEIEAAAAALRVTP